MTSSRSTPKRQLSIEGPTKTLALNDFYFDGGRKLGTFQTIGLPLQPNYVLAYLRYVEERDPHWWRRAVSRFMPWAANQTERFFGRATLFATVLEDLPLS